MTDVAKIYEDAENKAIAKIALKIDMLVDSYKKDQAGIYNDEISSMIVQAKIFSLMQLKDALFNDEDE